MNTIKDETGTYVELPKEKIKFVSKEAEVMFDLSMENDYLQKENQELKSQIEHYRKTNEHLIDKNNILLRNAEHNDKVVDKVNWENKHYKHIIDELEKWLKETKLKEFEKAYGKRYGKVYTQAEIIVFNMILNKLQELKGDAND